MTDAPARTWRQLLDEASGLVRSRQEAKWLIEEASGYGPSDLMLHLDEHVTARMGAYLSQMVERRRGGEPLQYVLGRWPFRKLDLMVDRRVLIPRPETEQVVEWAIAEARALGRHPIRAADLGTGSGAIALSLAAELAAHVWATDVSADALEVATANMAGSGMVARRVRAHHGSWWEALPDDLRGGLDLVVSNPPYVSEHDPLPPEVVDYEPLIALRAGPDGMDAITEVIAGARDWLSPGGVLVVELDPRQAEAAGGLARSRGAVRADTRRDAQGRERAGRPVVSAAEVLRNGGVVLLPTDTVYGLAVDPTVPGATQRLFDLKARGRDIPIAVLVGDAEQAWSVAAEPVPESARSLAAEFWPGGLTIVVARHAGWSADLGDDARTVGLRCPDADLVRALCREVGPLATTSANRHGRATATTAAAAAGELPGVDLVIDGGELSGLPSTVVDCTVDPPKVVREGAVVL